MSKKTQEEVQVRSEEELAQAMAKMTPEQMEEMQKNMEKMKQEQIENAKKQQQEQIEMLTKVLTEFIPMFKEYVPKAIRTESAMNPFKDDVSVNIRITHSMIGITTELNELNKAVALQDNVNIIEELGDVLWYLAIAEDTLNFTESFDISTENINSIFLGEDEAYSTDVLDLIKRSMFYGSEFDEGECIKPYISMLLGVIINSLKLGVDLTEIIDVNLKKLYTRYPDKFTKELAELRDLAKERETLETATTEVSGDQDTEEKA